MSQAGKGVPFMLLRDLVAGIATIQRTAGTTPSPIITNLCEDSRRVTPGCLYVARAGSQADGRAFVADAIAKGAAAVLYDDSDGSGDPCAPEAAVIRVRLNPSKNPGGAGGSAISLAVCRMAERFEGNPSEWLHLVGLTGTNGKTTTAYLIQQFVRAGGSPCGVIGTVAVDDGATKRVADLTTPSGIDLSAALGRMVANGCSTCAMEVSSHALDQGRASALRFKTAVFTNLTGDHLDYHKGMDEYAVAKARLFSMLPADGTAIVNVDDPWHARMLLQCTSKVVRCSLVAETVNLEHGCHATIHSASMGWQDVTFAGAFGIVRTKLPLVGRHNAMNALQAAAAAHASGVCGEAICRALAHCAAPPGRLEPVTSQDHPFAVLVDYAHTDDALLNALTALRPLVGRGGRLTVVFGCGGERDRTKRPRMMKVACQNADRVIVTSDNPRGEEPEAIIDEILAGRSAAPRKVVIQRQADRARAIDLAVQEARVGDIILIAGKGHEDYQIVGKTKRPFDDRRVAQAALGHDGSEHAQTRQPEDVGAP
jgi:UDP-N-acetylmuramoyl-L-alanyl-D-glutamate--2,6-diaminopimelate ligase